MPRPRKCRSVCCMPGCTRFGPLNEGPNPMAIVRMTVEEYETIRLIDLEGLTQDGCAERMQVARGSIQCHYKLAREKLADSLVNAKILIIGGGDFQLYQGMGRDPGCGHCQRTGCSRRECCETHEAHRQKGESNE